jgi:preprotein translocase subunit YajC
MGHRCRQRHTRGRQWKLPLEVARITASAAVVASGGLAGVVIFTDSNFEIALGNAKEEASPC